MTLYNIYCDESCYLEHDGHGCMVLGGIWCPADKSQQIGEDLRDIRKRHDIGSHREVKWTKVSQAKVEFYKELVDYFFANEHLAFRAVVVPDKSKLRHGDYGQTHDDFYYKLYFQLLQFWIDDAHEFRIFLDIKDTKSWAKTQKLRDVLANDIYDFDRSVVRSIELVRSEQVQLIQLTDLFVGAVGHATRKLHGSIGKLAVIEEIRARSGRNLLRSTPIAAKKFNIFVFSPRERES
jgi:hypothetical protein